jgi:hypothetical protein
MEDKLEITRGDSSRHIAPVLSTAQSIINTDVRDIAYGIVNSILETSNDPLTAVAALKRIEKALEVVMKDDDLKDHLLSEYRKYGDKPMTKGNAIISYGSTYTDYDYKSSGHLEYNALLLIVDTCNARMKSIEKDLRNIKQKRDMEFRFIPELREVEYDEVATVHPPGKFQKFGFKFQMR